LRNAREKVEVRGSGQSNEEAATVRKSTPHYRKLGATISNVTEV